MSQRSVREFFAARHLDIPIVELDVSTATVALAAQAHGVEAGRISPARPAEITAGERVDVCRA
jgi:hypothetical protein